MVYTLHPSYYQDMAQTKGSWDNKSVKQNASKNKGHSNR
jgi:hypothetical protein